jgi:hypothetical protein
MAFSAQSLNTISEAKALALTLSPRYSHETSPVFQEGKVAGYFVRLLKKDHRGVTIGQAILRDEEAKDFVRTVAKATNQGQTQRLIKAWFAEVN